eukprot:m.165544 g.165544  ORF g.165544 m.165544 type:complete len:70 (-) comp24002_c0_seq1:1856-2065(-)
MWALGVPLFQTQSKARRLSVGLSRFHELGQNHSGISPATVVDHHGNDCNGHDPQDAPSNHPAQRVSLGR